MERSEQAFFIGKAEEAEKKAAAAAEAKQRETWLEIAREYRKLSGMRAQPKERI
jgi:hypothetical protein